MKIQPLADKLRPYKWEDFVGQENINTPLLKLLKSGEGNLPSLVLWGPPGCGKTTLAKLVGETFNVNFEQFSAVLGGVKEVRAVIDRARDIDKQTLLFIDEIHRFNKAQQDAFLPHVENGTIVLIGATTENPSFVLTSALLSRVKIVRLKSLNKEDLEKLLEKAIKEVGVNLSEESKEMLISSSGGDARKLLNILENCFASIKKENIEKKDIEEFLKHSDEYYYDRVESHYDTISAFIKSLRGSDSNAALFWGFRMLEAGDDPRFLIRRMIIFASEDIGNADPRALQLSLATMEAYNTIGYPEAKINISHCITYLASAPKSNRSYKAMLKTIAAVKKYKDLKVPLHLRNATTGLLKSLDYGKGYKYPHDYNYSEDINYLPEEIEDLKLYEPSERGYEKIIKERAEYLKKLKEK